MSPYRCRLMRDDLPSLPEQAETIQLKADNAVKAAELAHLVTGAAVIDVERQDDDMHTESIVVPTL